VICGTKKEQVVKIYRFGVGETAEVWVRELDPGRLRRWRVGDTQEPYASAIFGTLIAAISISQGHFKNSRSI
jgi:hypothetical protein